MTRQAGHAADQGQRHAGRSCPATGLAPLPLDCCVRCFFVAVLRRAGDQRRKRQSPSTTHSSSTTWPRTGENGHTRNDRQRDRNTQVRRPIHNRDPHAGRAEFSRHDAGRRRGDHGVDLGHLVWRRGALVARAPLAVSHLRLPLVAAVEGRQRSAPGRSRRRAIKGQGVRRGATAARPSPTSQDMRAPSLKSGRSWTSCNSPSAMPGLERWRPVEF